MHHKKRKYEKSVKWNEMKTRRQGSRKNVAHSNMWEYFEIAKSVGRTIDTLNAYQKWEIKGEVENMDWTDEIDCTLW